MVCTWIELTQVFTESILVLKLQRNGPKVPFVSLLNSSVARSFWIVEKIYPVKLASNLFSFSSLNQSSSSFLKDLRSRVWMLHNVHNFAGPMQKAHRVIYFQLGNVTQYLILWHIPETDFMYDKTNVATFPTLHRFFFIRILFVKITRLKIP